jgi:hypothetical protein
MVRFLTFAVTHTLSLEPDKDALSENGWGEPDTILNFV